MAKIREVDDPPEDGSSLSYELVETLETADVAAGESFEVFVRAGYLTASGTGFALPDGRQVECDNATLCNDIDTGLAGQDSFSLTLVHPSDPRDTTLALTATAIDAEL